MNKTLDDNELFTVHRNGQSKVGSNIVWTDEQINLIIDLYEFWGLYVKRIAETFDCSEQAIRAVLRRRGVHIKSRAEMGKEIHPRNSDYFECIDSKEKAYWLGFLYADGSVNRSHNTLRINLGRVDEEHLRKFLFAIQALTMPIRQTQKVDKNKIYYGSYIAVTDKKMVSDLEKLGCVEKKSLILTYPTEDVLPKEFESHFVRGYFDGDGSISTNRAEKTKHGDSTLEYFQVSFVGTYDILAGIKRAIGKPDIKMENKKTHFSIHIDGNAQLKRIMQYMYQDSSPSIELTRKREKAEILCRQKGRSGELQLVKELGI